MNPAQQRTILLIVILLFVAGIKLASNADEWQFQQHTVQQ